MKYRFDGISEFVSRRARVKLVELILHNGMSQSELAALLHVTQPAVSKWLNPRETHPRNQNLDRLLKLAWQIDRKSVTKILREELVTFAKLLSKNWKPIKRI